MHCYRPMPWLAASFLALCGYAAAHDMPSDVNVQMFVKPADERLQLVVRVPLKAIRDVVFPERADGYLDVEELAPLLGDAAKVWIADFVEIQEAGTRLANPRIAATQLSFESDRSFTSFDSALAHVTGPKLSGSAHVVWNQVLLDVLLEYGIRSNRSRFSIRPGLDGLAARVVTVLRFVPAEGAVRAFEFTSDPGLVPLDPQWHQAALRFVKLGFLHILDGTDHLLFLLCLVIPLRRLWALIQVITAFTVAHSITLLGSAYGLAPDALWFPPLIEMSIAVSIVYMALENIAGTISERRWMIAFGFGLVHGFGFSFALRETLQFAGSYLVTSLLSFNVGVELGQLLVLALLVPALGALFRFVVAERMGTIILSALVAHTGWHWMLDRGAVLGRFPWPTFDAAFVAGTMRWLIGILMMAAAIGFVFRLHRRRSGSPENKEGLGAQPESSGGVQTGA